MSAEIVLWNASKVVEMVIGYSDNAYGKSIIKDLRNKTIQKSIQSNSKYIDIVRWLCSMNIVLYDTRFKWE